MAVPVLPPPPPPPRRLPNIPPAPPPNDAIIALVINACVAIWISVLITVSPRELKIFDIPSLNEVAPVRTLVMLLEIELVVASRISLVAVAAIELRSAA